MSYKFGPTHEITLNNLLSTPDSAYGTSVCIEFLGLPNEALGAAVCLTNTIDLIPVSVYGNSTCIVETIQLLGEAPYGASICIDTFGLCFLHSELEELGQASRCVLEELGQANRSIGICP